MEKFKRGKPIKAQARQVIYNVYLYFLQEANTFKKEHNGYFQKLQERVAKSTGVSTRTLRQILKEKDENGSAPFKSPKKGRPKLKYRNKHDEFDYCIIRNTIYDIHLQRKELPVLRTLKSKLVEAIQFKGCTETLRTMLKEMGFRFHKSECNKRMLMEKRDIRLKRSKYLRDIQKMRTEGRNIVFMNESCVTSNTKGKSCSDSSQKGAKQPITKGERLVIVHAGNEQGFVPGALMVQKCMNSDSDYHKEINADRYEAWFRNQLIPNLPTNSVLVIDSTLHDTKLLEIDRIMQEHGHAILLLLPFHSDFNPIENVLSQIKRYVAEKNIATNVTLEDILFEKIDSFEAEEWVKVCDQAIKCEEEYRSLEPRFDAYIENFIINNCSSSDESDNLNASEHSMSGVETISDSD